MVLDRAISVSDVLRATACATPQRDAVVDEAGSLSYRQFDETVDRLAAGLQRLGVGAGDRVAYLLWNQRELLLSYFSIARLGALTVSLNFRLTAEELAYQLTAAKCKALIVDEDLAGLASQAVANSGLQIQVIVCGNGGRPDQLRFDDLLGGSTEDIASFPIVSSDADSGIWFTSGTTGRPKGAVVKHRSAVAAATLSAIALGFPDEVRSLGVAPLFHRGAMENFALPVVMCGGTNFLFKKFDAARTLQNLEKYRIQLAFIVPTMAWQLVHEPLAEKKSLPHLTHWISASAPLPPVLAERIQERFRLPNGVTNAYGITEMLFVSKCPPAMLTKKLGTAGLPAPGTQIVIHDEKRGVLPHGEVGEILISGPTAFSRYLDNEQATREAIINLNGQEWYRSGDVGVIDEDGYLAIKDRKKDMIISGGENVYCAEVELVLIDHPSIREVAVVGVPDEKWGEVVVAAIVKAADAPIDLDDIVRSCASLASYKRPREVVCLDALPRNSFGKVRKDLVREMVRERLPATMRVRRAS
ncbi:class I adenylate-forming enzyme family protein [Bradyrhizobium iriomotense]|uniref:class I adenylate-forming enzyme family protein n=1 Tax=Bradyrhizobium iriomotense TaxID=441950 RepID=UPI001B8A5385|nr:class I adenylate-forming enzyme family protein [Bradyrhizobium iriomotense]MBR1130844.1 acyl--CoA ligase [Bradyrhizobium iriomotense]